MRCRIPQYGLCLTCSVEEFGEGWKPTETSELPVEEGMGESIVDDETSTYEARKTHTEEERMEAIPAPQEVTGLSSPEGGNAMPRRTLARRHAGKKNLCVECEKRPIWIKKRGLCEPCAQRFYKENPQHTKTRRKRMDNMIDRAKEALNGREFASAKFLQSALHIRWKAAANLLVELEKQGVVSHQYGNGTRRILAGRELRKPRRSRESKAPEVAPHNDKIAKLKSFAKIIGEESSFGKLLLGVIDDLEKYENLKHTLRTIQA